MVDRERTLLAGRVKRIQQLLGRELQAPWPSSDPLPESDRSYLRETGEEFYWNDLEWEKLTGEEQVGEEFLTELAFPGFLAFVRGLLLEETMPDSVAPARPQPAGRSHHFRPTSAPAPDFHLNTPPSCPYSVGTTHTHSPAAPLPGYVLYSFRSISSLSGLIIAANFRK